MAQQEFEIRFNKARIRLNTSLKELEESVIEKLYETAEQSRMLQNSVDNPLSSKVNKQFSTIQNLSAEINKLQKNLATLGKENEVLLAENNNLQKNQAQKISLIKAIESDLLHIEEIISGVAND